MQWAVGLVRVTASWHPGQVAFPLTAYNRIGFLGLNPFSGHRHARARIGVFACFQPSVREHDDR